MSLGALTFRPRYGAEAASDNARGVELRGEIEWFVTGADAEVATLLAAVGRHGERVAAGSAILRFGNAVGSFDLGSLGALRVRCGKFTEATWDQLLQDLTEKLMQLPFSATQAASIPHDRSIADRSDILLHAFVYARHALLTSGPGHSLTSVFETILRDPHRRFETERARVDVSVARRADLRTLAKLASAEGGLVRAPEALMQHELVQMLGGHLPRHVDTSRLRDTFDTAENRFVLELLEQLGAIVRRVEQLARDRKKPSQFWDQALLDCERMKRALGPIERHRVWESVGPMDHVPFASAVLQQRRGYKEALRHYLMLRASAQIPFDEREVEEQLGLKDVASLYELWCYFQVVDSVEKLLGRRPDVVERFKVEIEQVDVPYAFAVSWKDGPTVYYNLTFSRTAKGRRSSSLMLRPDIVLEIREGEHLEMHVFDAKLKVQGLEAMIDGVDASEGGGDALTFKREDVAKMHAYRDALPSVRSARVLYPGEVGMTFPSLEPNASARDAIGVVPLIPGRDTVALETVLASILKR